MNGMILTAHGVTGVLADIEQRWAGLRNRSASNDMDALSYLFYGAVVLVIGAMVALLVTRRREMQRRLWQSFETDAQHVGLSHAEQELLTLMARLAGLRRPEGIFSIEQAFERGAARLKESPRVKDMPAEKQEHVAAMVLTISQKLGFTPLPKVAPSTVSTFQIQPGSPLTLTVHDTDREYEVTVSASTEAEMIVTLPVGADVAAKEMVMMHYSSLGTVWEYETEVLAVNGREVHLQQTSHIRFINRRRFPRVETMHEAMVATFKFFQDGHDMQEPHFVNAILSEIAGPGLLLEAPLTVELNDKVLVMVLFDIDRVVQGLGKVRRVTPIDSQRNTIAVELMDLKPEEVSELARQTNAAAQQVARKHQYQEQLATSHV